MDKLFIYILGFFKCMIVFLLCISVIKPVDTCLKVTETSDNNKCPNKYTLQ